MPGGSGTAAGGFDGVVTATGQSTFVPSGTSVWELSVGGGQGEADDDYTKRTEAPDNLSTDAVAYVEALLVPWTKARAWAVERTKEGRWREVRGYNLDRTHAWLDVAPATTAWLAGQLGKALPGVRCLGTWRPRRRRSAQAAQPAIEAQLQSSGVPRDEAARLGTLGRRSLLALRRTLARHYVRLAGAPSRPLAFEYGANDLGINMVC